jgi:UDP-N-acetylmuramate dehydrogenase
VDLQRNVLLAPYTTFRIGGPARFFTHARSHEDLLEALIFARSESLPVFVLGGGSNLLVAGEGYPGLVIQLALAGEPEVDGDLHEIPAGTDWDTFVRGTCEQGFSGVECLAGIPGLTGATPVQNVGAYGQEVAQTIARVTAIDRQTLATVHLDNRACRFGYRASVFNTTERDRYIVTSVQFRLKLGGSPELSYADLKRHFGTRQPTPYEVYEAVRQIRRAKGMLLVEGDPDSRSAGSFFKNPIVPLELLPAIAAAAGETSVPNWPVSDHGTKLPAAWLVERAGFPKGFQLGAAGISSRHTLALINRTGAASCSEILQLKSTIAGEVERRFGVRLEQEPICLK